MISPELVLVSPGLAGAARQDLPDCPWEVALRTARQSTSTAVRLEVVRRDQGREESSAWDGAHRQHLACGLVLAAIAVLWLVVATPLAEMFTDDGMERLTTSVPAVRTPGATQTERKPPRSLLARAGYVVSPRGSFMTGASGRTITSFTLPLRCGPRQVVIEDVPVSGRRFRFTGRAVGSAITVRLSAQLLSRERVRGVVVAKGASCSARVVEFSARLS